MIMHQRAMSYWPLERYEEALADCDRGLELDPQNEFEPRNAVLVEMKELIRKAIARSSSSDQSHTRDQDLQWEYCEVREESVVGGVTGILLNLANRYSYRLEAVATGPRGRYHVAYSPSFSTAEYVSRGGGALDGEPALAALTNELIQDGWEPLPGGFFWWQAQFRRPVRM